MSATSLFSYPNGVNRMDDWQPWRCHGVEWRIAPDAPADLRERLADWDPFHAAAVDVEVLKRHRGRNITARGDLVMKTMYPKPGLWHRTRFGVRPSVARRACCLALGLRAAGAPVAQPFAFGRRRTFGLTLAEITVAQRLCNADKLSVWLRRKSGLQPKILAAYGALMGTFHAHGFSNRDLKDGNVLCLRDDPSSLWVADLDGVRYVRRLNRFRRARDWRVLVRSAAYCGCADEASLTCMLEGYHAVVPPRFSRLPNPRISP